MKEMENALDIDWTLLGPQLVVLAALFMAGVLYFRELCRTLPIVWQSCRGWGRVFWMTVVVLLPFVGASLARRSLAQGTRGRSV
jgi:hypothetical protein